MLRLMLQFDLADGDALMRLFLQRVDHQARVRRNGTATIMSDAFVRSNTVDGVLDLCPDRPRELVTSLFPHCFQVGQHGLRVSAKPSECSKDLCEGGRIVRDRPPRLIALE